MKFIYLGSCEQSVNYLTKSLCRSEISIDRVSRPEAAFFKILQEPVAAIFVDLSGPDINGEDVIVNLHSLDKDLEVVLISEAELLNIYPTEILRMCYGYLLPQMDVKTNAMVLSELTEKLTAKEHLETLKNTSNIDGLTQLYNHAYFQQRMDEEIQLLKPNHEPISLVIFDIDNFKNYNDTNGHPAGDRVLQKFAELLGQSVRKFDLIARYGGEEFVIMLPDTGLETALLVAERFRKRVVETKFEHGHKQPMGLVSSSFGAATIDHEVLISKREVIEFADQALYKAKHNGKNCIWYYLDGDFSVFNPPA